MFIEPRGLSTPIFQTGVNENWKQFQTFSIKLIDLHISEIPVVEFRRF